MVGSASGLVDARPEVGFKRRQRHLPRRRFVDAVSRDLAASPGMDEWP
ncbi:hypothetical protein [Oceanithermus sp.]